MSLDLQIFLWVNRDGGRWFDAAARLLSAPAFGVAVGVGIALALWRAAGRRAARPLAAFGIGIALTDAVGSQLLRHLLTRQRPCYGPYREAVRHLLRAADVPSFPSLHAANFFALAFFAARADRRLAAPAYAVAAAVALSRVYGGVHWPSDIIGGAAWGTLCAAFAWWCAERLSRSAGKQPAVE
jgi:undecaprenyl-diphosphatase